MIGVHFSVAKFDIFSQFVVGGAVWFLTAIMSFLQSQRRHVIGYFDSDTSQDYKIYHKVASILRDDCSFHAAIGSVHVSPSCVYHGSCSYQVQVNHI